MDAPEYKISDFKGLMREIFEIPDSKSILKHTTKLNYPEFKVSLLSHGFNKDQVIRYIACVYDMESPFRKDYLDIPSRKIMACLYVGIEMDDNGKFTDNVEKMMLCEIVPVTAMIVRYCRTFNEKDFSYLMALTDVFYRQLQDLHAGEINNISNVQKVRTEIDGVTHRLIAGDNTRDLQKSLHALVDKEQLELRPEHIAMKLKDGVPPVSYKDVQGYKSANS